MRSLLFSPSLVRRVFVALLLAFLLVAAMLAARDLYRFNDEMNGRAGWLSKSGQIFARSLHAIGDRAEAISATRVAEALFVASFEESDVRDEGGLPQVFFQLGTPSGEILYETIPHGTLLPGSNGEMSMTRLRGRDYWVFASTDERWSVRMGFLDLRKGMLLWLSLRELLAPLLLSFPLILIPLWLAVRRGLRPLDELSQRLVARSDDDLSPLAIDMRYAELEQVTTAIENLLMRLRRKIDNERVFIQDAAHELRTPMAVISAQAHVLVHAPSGKDQARAQLALDEAIRRASHLSAQLLSLASLDHRGVLDRQSVEVAGLLQELLAQMAPVALARQIDLSLEAPDRLCLELNRVAFISIVHNLLDNALRYGNDRGRVIVTLISDSRESVLRVADDGPGIGADEREQVFERFYRGRGHDATGTGLGLAIVGRAVHAMGAAIHLEDGLDRAGVAFVIRFPKPPVSPASLS